MVELWLSISKKSGKIAFLFEFFQIKMVNVIILKRFLVFKSQIMSRICLRNFRHLIFRQQHLAKRT